MANAITGVRIVCSLALLLCPAFSIPFYVLYISAGFSDMIDGAVARKTGTDSEFGSKLDTLADIVFTAVCMLRLLPLIEMPVWIYMWTAGIAFIKLSSVFISFVRLKNLTSVHSVLNKITGAALFVFPLSLDLINTTLSAAAICVIATVAAIHESNFVLRHSS